MTRFSHSFVASLLAAVLLATAARADPAPRPFTAGSLAEVAQARTGKPFLLLLWSLDCASCIKEMDGLADTLAQHPELNLVIVATDDIADADRVDALLQKHRLGAVESWMFADANAQKLRHAIDPTWLGELPRSYFYDANHQRKGQSGMVKPEQILTWLASLK